ncbi:hypothetical protein H3T83_10890 [Gilliamella sp. M0320]|uniref:hypothetical protein n=1 Tax=Gilliamella sp. M0320 TaxID=2750965 RepID=UPI0018DB2D94|nr:hypothetical protein [Gilliamella sp. M0320]MBI0061698.1 hypothetical protein [Gilliamella sp. M0320]
MVLVLTMVVLQSISFANYALTTQTTNVIQGSAPYLTFDGGRTRVTNSEGLLWISLSDGRRFTPTTNNSRYTPIELPVAGQSFNDIGMLVPTDTDSIALSSLIGTPYNYWGDDDGDGQGIDGVTATGSLNLSIVTQYNSPVARNEVLTFCDGKAPYKLTLSNTSGTLKTRYGVPNERYFTAGNVTYYINPKASPVICTVRPSAFVENKGLSDAVWDPAHRAFLPQSFTPSSYGLNFPTTGANGLYFYLDIRGASQALSWAPVSHGGITATMTNLTNGSVRVTLTGPVATKSQWESENPDSIDRPSLPQTFELVGRDSSGNAVLKYGFELKQWFVNRGLNWYSYSSMESWCNKIGGYSVPMVKDLTNACAIVEEGGKPECATPASPDNEYRRHIGAGLFSEWGDMRVQYYDGANFGIVGGYWTIDNTIQTNVKFIISADNGSIGARLSNNYIHGLCVYPRSR